MKRKFLQTLLLLLVTVFAMNAQDVYQHTSKYSIYEFLEEAANQQIIDINTAVKPFSRSFIAEQLSTIDENRTSLNNRQQKELDFFLRDYNKELKREDFNKTYNSDKFFKKENFFHKSEDKRLDAYFFSSDKFQATVNPVLGMNYNLSASAFQRWYGAELNMYLGKNFGAYVSFRDLSENKKMTSSEFLNQLPAGVNRPNNRRSVTDYSEIRGGLTYSWKWGSVGLLQEQIVMGNNNHGSIIMSGNAPAIPHIKVQVKPTKWFEFNYMYAFLNSEEIDSVRTYQVNNGVDRIIYQNKFMATNMFTITPVKNLRFSFGNAMIYSDNPHNIGYIIPLFFYKSIDHANSSQNNKAGQNGQLFFDISSRNLKYVHLYASLFIDEIRFSTFFDEAEQRNQLGFKIGADARNILNSNLSAKVEYTRSNPYTYRHYIPSLDYASNNYNMGHYLGDNSREIYLELNYKILPRLKATAYFLNATKGGVEPFGPGGIGGVSGTPFQRTIDFERQEIGLTVDYEILHDIYVKGSLILSDVTDNTNTYTPEFERGNNTFASLSVNWGF